jgi:tetratricopeptide (TPR) repeat protein
LTAEGRNTEAAACRRIVKAARIEEQAASESSVGLSSQAAESYMQALKVYPADYVAQLRLSGVIEGLDKPNEALAAYEQALKLLPASLGPTGGMDPFEWHTFRNESERDAVREALASMKRQQPRNPGILWAIGRFDSKTGDDKGALASYEEAVKVDPRYLRAWEGIAALAPKGVASKEQIQEAVLSLIGLDPLSGLNNYSRPALVAFADKSPLWLAYRKAAGSMPQLPTAPLYPLEASKRSLAAGTRPTPPRDVPGGYDSPGAFLGSLPELRALSP